VGGSAFPTRPRPSRRPLCWPDATEGRANLLEQLTESPHFGGAEKEAPGIFTIPRASLGGRGATSETSRPSWTSTYRFRGPHDRHEVPMGARACERKVSVFSPSTSFGERQVWSVRCLALVASPFLAEALRYSKAAATHGTSGLARPKPQKKDLA
jgi:hypothetical protein